MTPKAVTRFLLSTTALTILAQVATAAPAEQTAVDAPSGHSDDQTATVATANETATTDYNTVEQVVVTAQRREESIQDVPIAITAVGGNQLLQDSILTANDISRLAPNLTGANGGGRVARPRWFLRGVGVNDPSPNVASPIGIYIDDVYYGDTAYETFPLFDQERVEVLSGPQGTLWGKNTIGGAINYISKAPTFDPDGYARVEFGNYSSKALEGAYGTGLIEDKLAARVSFDYEDRGGYYKNLYDGTTLGGLTDEAVRLQFLAKPSDNVDITLNGHARKLQDTGAPTYPVGSLAGGANLYGYIPSYGTTPRIGDPVDLDGPDGATDLSSEGAYLNVKWHFGDYVLTSISSYDETQHHGLTDSDYSPLPVSEGYSAVKSHQVTQELRLASPASDRFNWLGGFHYFNEDFSSNAASASLVANPIGTTGPASTQNILSYQDTYFTQRTTSYAVFGNATYSFTDKLHLSGGIRWTSETKGIDLVSVQTPKGAVVFNNSVDWWLSSSVTTPHPIPVNATQDQTNTWNKVTYSVTPEYDITDNAHAYFRYATGFRSGGYNGNVAAQVAVSTVQPETLTDYELGLKTQWLEGKLTANASAFYYNYDNIQVNIQGTLAGSNVSGTTLRNAANGKIDGLELALAATPVKNLYIAVNGGYLLDAKYENFQTVVITNGVAVPVNASGNQIARAPKATATVNVEYTIPVSFGGAFKIGTDWDYRSHIFFNAVNQTDPLQQQGGYWLGNARLSYVTENGRFEIGAYATNILQQEYVNNANAPTATGFYRVSLGLPRTYGLTVTTKF